MATAGQYGFQFEREEQERQINRVANGIAKYVLAFCRERIGKEFRGEELRQYVRENAGIAPASPDRILRDLRQHGLVGYDVVDRRASLYRVNYAAMAVKG